MKKMCSKAPILPTQSYTKNPDSPLELDLQQEDTLSTRRQWTLVASGTQQMTGGIRASGVSDYHRGRDSPEDGWDKTRKEGQDIRTDGTKIGWEMRQDRERRNT